MYEVRLYKYLYLPQPLIRIYMDRVINVLLFLVITGTVYCQADYQDYPGWMEQHKSVLISRRVNQIPILGSHDASSCYINENSPPSSGYIDRDGDHIVSLPGESGVGLAKCQSESIRAQLDHGSRFLVLPVCTQDEEYWSFHIWLTRPLFGEEGIFGEIQQFLAGFPNEIILVYFRAPLYTATGRMNLDEEKHFYQRVRQELDTFLIRPGSFGETTIGNIWKSSGRILVIGDPDADDPADPIIWDEKEMESHWMDTTDPEGLMEDLTEELQEWSEDPDPSRLYILSGVTTTREKLENARITNELLQEHLASGWRKYPINVVLVDDAARSGLMPLLLERIQH